jgi:hypothetical protein
MLRFVAATALVAVSAIAVPDTVNAQTSDRFEVGAQFATMRLSGLDATDAGFGGWTSWRLNERFSLEGAAEFFPNGKNDVTRGGRKFHALFGPKALWRTSRVGVFAKTRAGVARVGEGRSGVRACILIFPPPEGCFEGESRLALDLGGGVEFYPTDESTIRVDVSSMATRLGRSSVRFANVGVFAHDLHVTMGWGWRF